VPDYKLRIEAPRPFFAELPAYLWGRVNYDSDGDCETPLDRSWTGMTVENRNTEETIDLSSDGATWTVSGPDPAAARMACFLVARCAGHALDGAPEKNVGDWDHAAALARADRVRREFENPLLAPFGVDHGFWGSWKWIGWFGTDFTWGGRWIMDAVVRGDARAVSLCIDWLRGGTVMKSQSAALRHALRHLTGLAHDTDAAWIRWYDDEGGRDAFPQPDMDAWYRDLKAIHGADDGAS
jgi:hypothetical protein